MSDDITIRGGGVVAVDTEEHLRFAGLLLELGDACASWADRAESVSTDDFSVCSSAHPSSPKQTPGRGVRRRRGRPLTSAMRVRTRRGWEGT
ncbi:hypothetical protein ITJ57_00075 [Plantibacter sp. VKM Ac-2880]|uniref:hypothetical protein n=1 Tax=Plantibacter sp. VKM Ac-2880 TaxID=2783827 RepID=UPI00188F50D5|nr:hypothetical protein [Plantibacter sp. VKM Ac-2880]MBF4567146.1 hypothetical protein [Plantibacter sp. VKM Ac-2880]